MKKKISKKDKQDWLTFINSQNKIYDKDNITRAEGITEKEKIIDLHGYSLENANETMNVFINKCFKEKVTKITVITGKGSRSKNKNNPYQSKNLSILKYSVPNYIQSEHALMQMIRKINLKQVNDNFSGSFDIFLKKTKE